MNFPVPSNTRTPGDFGQPSSRERSIRPFAAILRKYPIYCTVFSPSPSSICGWLSRSYPPTPSISSVLLNFGLFSLETIRFTSTFSRVLYEKPSESEILGYRCVLSGESLCTYTLFEELSDYRVNLICFQFLVVCPRGEETTDFSWSVSGKKPLDIFI